MALGLAVVQERVALSRRIPRRDAEERAIRRTVVFGTALAHLAFLMAVVDLTPPPEFKPLPPPSPPLTIEEIRIIPKETVEALDKPEPAELAFIDPEPAWAAPTAPDLTESLGAREPDVLPGLEPVAVAPPPEALPEALVGFESSRMPRSVRVRPRTNSAIFAELQGGTAVLSSLQEGNALAELVGTTGATGLGLVGTSEGMGLLTGGTATGRLAIGGIATGSIATGGKGAGVPGGGGEVLAGRVSGNAPDGAGVLRGPALDSESELMRRYAARVREAIMRARTYPAAAEDDGLEGTVVLAITVDGQGTILDVSVARSSGHPTLDKAALASTKALAHLPPPPPELKWDKKTFRIQISYVLDAL